jgi:hypothetical protein
MEQVTISQTETIVVDNDTSVIVVTGLMGPPSTVTSLAQVPDVDISDLRNGSLLVYSTETTKWKATTTLDRQTIEAGQF